MVRAEIGCPIIRYPRGILFPVLFWGLLIKAEHWEKGHLVIEGLMGNLDYEVLFKGYIGICRV